MSSGPLTFCRSTNQLLANCVGSEHDIKSLLMGLWQTFSAHGDIWYRPKVDMYFGF